MLDLDSAADPPLDPNDPDARFALHGPDGLGDAELLAYLLTRGGPPGDASVALARAVLRGVGGLSGLRIARQGQLEGVVGVGPSKARRLLALAALATRMAERPIARGELIDSPRRVWEALRGRSGPGSPESFWVISLDSHGRRLAIEVAARGGRNFVLLTAADVFAPALREGAAAVVLAHNHPSGDPRPSHEDLRVTERLAAAGDLLGIEVRDHVVVAPDGFVSLAMEGVLPFGARGEAWPDAGDDGIPLGPDAGPTRRSQESA